MKSVLQRPTLSGLAKSMSTIFFRNRLVAILSTYDPDRIDDVDELLGRWQGREEEEIVKLVASYGEGAMEPLRPAEQAWLQQFGVDLTEPLDPRIGRAAAFYARYDPHGIPDTLRRTLEEFKDYPTEDELFTELWSELGVEEERNIFIERTACFLYKNHVNELRKTLTQMLAPLHPQRDRLIRFFVQYRPERLCSVDELLNQYMDNEQALFAGLVGEYGPEPVWDDTDASPPPNNDIGTQSQRQSQQQQSVSPNVAAPRGPAGGTSAASTTTLGNRLSDTQKPTKASASAVTAQPKVVQNPALRRRLFRFYGLYGPHKLWDVDAIIREHEKDVRGLFQKLTKAYGPEPPEEVTLPDELFELVEAERDLAELIHSVEMQLEQQYSRLSSSAIGAMTERLDVMRSGQNELHDSVHHVLEEYQKAARSRLAQLRPNPLTPEIRVRRMYQKYNPGKLGDVPVILKQYAGSEADLLDKLVMKYGAEPAPHEPLTEVEKARASEETVPHIDARRSHQTTPALQKRYNNQNPFLAWVWTQEEGSGEDRTSSTNVHFGKQPPSAEGGKLVRLPTHDLRDRLLQFYGYYNPCKILDIDYTLYEWKDHEGELMGALVDKYGPEPRLRAYNRYRERLYRHLAHHDPVALSQAETLLVQYATIEDELMRRLINKYGPEPAPSTLQHMQSDVLFDATSSAASPSRYGSPSPANLHSALQGESLRSLAAGTHPQLLGIEASAGQRQASPSSPTPTSMLALSPERSTSALSTLEVFKAQSAAKREAYAADMSRSISKRTSVGGSGSAGGGGGVARDTVSNRRSQSPAISRQTSIVMNTSNASIAYQRENQREKE